MKAFVSKKWIKKEEIPPKMYIAFQIDCIKPSLYQQRLIDLKTLLDENRLQRMFIADEFNSQYLISIVGEDHFKIMMDEYLQKVLVSGRVVPMEQREEYEKNKQRIKDLYWTFFYGQGLSDLEKEIEFQYLVQKQEKHIRDKCLWTYSQQRRIEGIANWVSRDVEYFDDFRPIFDPIRKDLYQQYLELEGVGKLEIFKRMYMRKQNDYLIGLLISRVLLYANCLEFIRLMRIPPDFYIEYQIANIHIWMIANRLNQFNRNDLSKQLKRFFRNYLAKEFSKIMYIKQDNDIKDVDQYLTESWKEFDRLFVQKEGNLYNLIWNVLYFQKIKQKNWQIKLMGEYVKVNWEYIQKVGLDKILNCQVEFDVYRIDLDFEQQSIEEIYNEDNLLNIKQVSGYNQLYSQTRSKGEKLVDQLHEKIFYHSKKYMNLDNYDQLSKHEEDLEKQQEKEDKYVWKDLKEINSRDEIDQLRKIIKSSRQN